MAHKSQEVELLLVVVGVTNGKFPALFGVSWFKQIRLNWERLFPTRNVNKESNIIQSHKQQFPKVFNRAPGPIRGHEANIILTPDAVPVFIPHQGKV